MAMAHNGLVKLSEECAEAIQVAQKLIAYPALRFSVETHPDGTVLRDRLEEELGDALAAIEFVTYKLELQNLAIRQRTEEKLCLYYKWDSEP